MIHPQPEVPGRYVRKTDSKLMRFLGRLPFVPSSFMTDFWTTIGHTIYTPSSLDHDSDYGKPTWESRHEQTIKHENVHVCQYETLGLVLFFVMYLGPAPFGLLAGLLLLPLQFAGFMGILPSICFAVALVTPSFSIGFAFGRWLLEREAYMVQMEYAASQGVAEETADLIADALWNGYFFTWPPDRAAQWFLNELERRG